MKIKKMCILLAMLCALTACENKKKEPAPENVPPVEVMGYRPAEIRLSDDFDRIISLDTNVGDVYIFGQLKTGGYSGYTTDYTFSEYESFSFIPQKNETIISSALLPFGKKAVLTYLDGKTMLYTYSKDGVQEKVIDCGEILDNPDMNADILPYGRENYIINADNKRLALIGDSGYLSDISVDGDIIGFSRGADNTVNCLSDDGKSKFTACIDINSGTLTDMKQVVINSGAYASCTGKKYYYIGVFEDGIYGITDSTVKKITDFTNMDFKPSEVTDIIETDDGYAVNVGGTIYFITEDDITELTAQKIIWVGCYGSHRYLHMDDYAEQYNKSQDVYKVKFREYDWDDDTLQADVISGNAPDIIPFGSYAPLDSYGRNSELFADMYTFLDNDPDLSREDFLPNILTGLERDGKLYQLGTSFIINANPTSSDSGIPENWTVDDMIKTYENLGKNDILFPEADFYLRESNFNLLFDKSMYIDYENAECSFDSPDFVKYLEFFQKNKIGHTYEEFDELHSRDDVLVIDQENILVFEEELAKKNVLISPYSTFYDSGGLYEAAKGDFKDKMIWAGYVGDGTKSGVLLKVQDLYGISAFSANADGAWDFLKTTFSELKTDGRTYYASCYFPVIEKDFDEALEEYTRDNVYVDWQTGKTVIEKRKYADKEIENFTPEECEYYKNKIMSARVYVEDYNIDEIISEEVYEYFENDDSAKQTAGNIQKKVSEYLNEHYK
ncbi:MAG: ABC transporter substrate-binding protein [Ruminococcus sp.]|nr:ABC transporter substrate-binding protein [Ruminococcus sp.]